MSADAPVQPVSGDLLEERPSSPLQEVNPSARCHACGDGVVVAICSRCARLLCRVHDSAAGPPLGPRAVLRLLRADSDDETATTPPTANKDKDKATVDKAGGKERAAGRGTQYPGPTADGAPADKNDRGTGRKADEPPATDPAADTADGQAAGGARPPSADRARERRAPADDEVPPTDTPPASKRRRPERRRERPRGAAQRHYCAGCVPQVRPYDAEILAATMTGGIGVFVLPVQHRTAVHCRSCRREHHLVAVPLGSGTEQ